MLDAQKSPAEAGMPNISRQIWDMKYRLKDAEKQPVDLTVEDTWSRIAKALAEAEPEAIRAEQEARFYKALEGFRYLPAGRIIAGSGTGRTVTLFNCLAGDTPVLTRERGLVRIADLAGQTVHVADGNGDWTASMVYDHGVQDLIEVELALGRTRKNRRSVRATPEHRWILDDGREVTTAELVIGDQIPVAYAKKNMHDNIAYLRGVAHGIIYGDGSEERSGDVSYGFRVRLCGDKAELLPHLEELGAMVTTPPSCEGDQIVRLPARLIWADLKSLPIGESPDYLLGFMRGWFATDGCVCARDGYPTLSCDDEGLAFLKTWGPVAGFFPKKATELAAETNYGPRTRRIWNVAIANWALEADDFLRTKHRENRTVTGYDWRVVGLTPVDADRVFCPEVPSTQSFVISDGVLTRNCFVMGTVPDSMDGIFDMLKEAALTMQQGGGIGYDFSTIRPKGARVKGVGSDASGPLSFMDVWDAMCGTIMSAGSRRGAMMATMRCDHPDVEDFITAKRDPARLRKFNLSVLVTDAFMAAVEADADWDLVWQGQVWRTLRARDLWDKIMKSTYAFAEPGVIFIDRINERNPLAYVEKIAATNPCVPAGTPILTREGWREIDTIVDTPVEVWNGAEWSRVTPRVTGHDQPMVRVSLSNGRGLICTTAHRFLTETGARVDAAALRPGQALLTHDWPVVRAGAPVEGAYAQGMRAGGAPVQARVAKKSTVMAGADGSDLPESLPGLIWGALPASFVPGADWDVASRLAWLAGLIDAGAEITGQGALVRSKDRGFLGAVQLLLNTLGAAATLRGDGALLIGAPALAALRGLGLPARTDLPAAAPSHGSGPVRVIAVEPLSEEADVVYCFTEEKRHAGCFDGVLTGQCGEQPLPPYGACLLGSINLARLISNPFTDEARLDEAEMEELVATAVRMMDNVVDVSRFPLPQQLAEAKAKRRIGLGVTGVADALLMLRLTYGTEEAAAQLEAWQRKIQHAAYRASVELAKEKGPFPLFDAEKYLASPTIQDLDADLQDAIREHGIRNALLTSIAPTGTISLYAGNVSSGIEPVFAYSYKRKITLDDGSKAEEEVVDYAVQMYRDLFGAEADLPEYFVSAQTLKPLDHVRMQAAAQKWVDSSISKTVNCPEDISFEEFKAVYEEAFRSGCKGCTTYRPNEITGSVLSVEPAKKEEKPAAVPAPQGSTPPMPRDPVLEGRTYKIKWPAASHAYYLTVNDAVDEAGVRRPFEVFVNTQNTHDADMLAALTRMISAVFRRGGDVGFVAEELSQIVNPQGGHWVEGRYVPSLVALIGAKLFEHMGAIGFLAPKAAPAAPIAAEPVPDLRPMRRTRPGCDTPDACDLVMESGCEKCVACGWSKCG